VERRCEPLYAPRKPQPMADPRWMTEGSVFNFAAVEQSLTPPRARIVGLTNGIKAVQDGRIQVGKCPCRRSEWTQCVSLTDRRL
jgi:hypothetical protein